jgi:hypothetical protein
MPTPESSIMENTPFEDVINQVDSINNWKKMIYKEFALLAESVIAEKAVGVNSSYIVLATSETNALSIINAGVSDIQSYAMCNYASKYYESRT